MRRFVLAVALLLACDAGPSGLTAMAGPPPPRPNLDPPVTLPTVLPDLSGAWEFHGLSQSSKPSLWVSHTETRTRVDANTYTFHRVAELALLNRQRVGQVVVDGTQSFSGGRLCETAGSVKLTLEPWTTNGETDLGTRLQRTYSTQGWSRFPCKVLQAVTSSEVTYTDGGVRGTERRPPPPSAASQATPR